MPDLKSLDAAFRIAEKVEKIITNNGNAGKGDRPLFNFFIGLTANKVHIEQYHTNFISYLLSTDKHDCGDLFFKRFLQMLQERCSPKSDDNKSTLIGKFLDQVENKNDISVGRERLISNGKVDIEIIFPTTQSALFIENKMRSVEGNNQLSAYFEHYAGGFQGGCMGIYLTKNGDSPDSVRKGSPHFKNLITLSYRNIIQWLEICHDEPELNHNPHIKGSLLQYIQVIKNELNIMGELNLEETVSYLLDHADKFSVLVKNQSELQSAIGTAVKAVRDKFLEELTEILTRSLGDAGYSLKRKDKDHFLCKYKGLRFLLYITQAYPDTDEGGKGLWWGVYDLEDGVFDVDLRLDNNCWESVKIEKVEDFTEDNKGAAKIIASMRDIEKKRSLLEAIVDAIRTGLDSKVIPALKEAGRK